MKTFLSRPGSIQMTIALVLATLAGLVPIYLACMMPSHEWFMVLTGLPAASMAAASLAILGLFFVGYIRYCISKGYSGWIGFWLFWSNLPGFIVLLLLPERVGANSSLESQKNSKRGAESFAK